MTKERIEDIREIVMPFMRKRLREIDYENLGESDAKEFERDFNEILNLAIQALEPRTNAFNKIKTEIQNLTVVYPFVNHIDQYVKKDDVIKIIDKYRQEE